MKKQIAMLLIILVSGAGALMAAGSREETERLQEAAEILKEIMDAPDEAIPGELLDRAECVIVVPSLKKGAFVVGGRFGRGAVSCRKEDGAGAWGPPSMLTIGGGSFGLQIGGQSSDVILLLMNRKAINHLLKSNFTLGADASAAAGPKGRSAEVGTDATMRAEILSYARTRGLFAGVSLEGAVVKNDKDANERLYGRRVESKDLLIDAKVDTPAAAKPLIDALTKYAPRNISAKK